MKIKEINELTRNCYNLIAEKYHQEFKDEITQKPFDKSLLDEFSKNFDENSLLCDAGCGPSAQVARYLNGKNLNIIGTDISDKCVDLAGKFNPGIKFCCTDFLEWDFPEDYFDGIVSYYSIIYTPKIYLDSVIKKFRDSLKINGKLLLVVKEGSTEGYQEEILGINIKTYFASFLEHEIKELLIRNGFKASYIYTRAPYDFEIKVNRIYGIGEKI
jgi:ubiquinone/menaquinone biosynthesis C-methylase UbiE